ncbi:hypothetical protein PUT78_21280 [Roseinatronobacter sp. HJB301]|uniref:Uncharacterized protein n=2 Tax=Roseinatronobacter alkalisoli TaxID=3028235 RepID=A0ABT5TER5_9RHOB|nr:hypothetical protein [Roseinatronobacter sp. HJB301]
MDPFSARASRSNAVVIRRFVPQVELLYSMITPLHTKLGDPIAFATRIVREEIEPSLPNWAFHNFREM